jgi:glycosyltransferase involved in cell wall biosynthesis
MPAPDVTVVISTHARPVECKEAVAAVVAQDFAGSIETIVVYDKAEPDPELESEDPRRPVRVMVNHRGHGLPGSRNAGAEAAAAPVIGFCDDDDLWLPDKVERQLELLERTNADAVVSGIEILYEDASVREVTPRPSPTSELRFEDLLRTRRIEANMVTALVRRAAFWERIGPMDELIPGGYGEDYEWMLRATQRAPLPVVPEPLVRVRWTSPSHFRRWDVVDDALGYLLDRHPELRTCRRGRARIEGQRAFARAAGQLGGAWGQIARTMWSYPLEPRAPLAAAVALRAVDADAVLARLNRSGRGV